MIPKIIHYCWFGGKPKPELALKCIESWKKYCPDYEIKEWNESNFDMAACEYIKEAYTEKKWAFITDYVRLYAMFYEGGIYMDTDVEVIHSLDPFLDNKAFSGFEDFSNIPTGIMACEKGFELFGEFLDYYKGRHFKLPDGTIDVTTNVLIITNLCKNKGFVPNNQEQIIGGGFKLYPKDFFCPKDYTSGKIELTDRTVTIHHFSGSWKGTDEKIAKAIRNFFGEKNKFSIIVGKVFSFPFTLASRIRIYGLKNTAKHYFLRKNL